MSSLVGETAGEPSNLSTVSVMLTKVEKVPWEHRGEGAESRSVLPGARQWNESCANLVLPLS